MDLITRINRTRFLGREFLTWLWYRADKQEGIFHHGDQTIEVWFDARMTLEGQGEIKEQSVIKSETPTATDEARAALQSGKYVSEARLRLISDQMQWTVTVKGDELSLGTLKIPALLTSEEDDRVEERCYLMEEVEDILDDLFAQFIHLRLGDDAWKEEVQDIREWVFSDTA